MRMDLPLESSFDEVLSQLTLVGPPVGSTAPSKILFWGEGVGEISSYMAGWMASQGIDVIVLDGANRFNPYMVSSFAKKSLISPENLLKRIRIARAFTCYQMVTLIEERLISLIRRERGLTRLQKTWVILLGPATPFLDEDVPEREIRPLFERSLKRVEGMAVEGIPFFLFQPSIPSDAKRASLTRRLFHFSNLVWKVSLEDQGLKVILEKRMESFPTLGKAPNIKHLPSPEHLPSASLLEAGLRAGRNNQNSKL